jgi:hypothetical protein
MACLSGPSTTVHQEFGLVAKGAKDSKDIVKDAEDSCTYHQHDTLVNLSQTEDYNDSDSQMGISRAVSGQLYRASHAELTKSHHLRSLTMFDVIEMYALN